MFIRRYAAAVALGLTVLLSATPSWAQRRDEFPPDDPGLEQPREEKPIDPRKIRYVVVEVEEDGKMTVYKVKYEHEWEKEYRDYRRQRKEAIDSYYESLKTWREQDAGERGERPRLQVGAKMKQVGPSFPQLEKAVEYAKARQEVSHKRWQAYLKRNPPKEEDTARPDDPALWDQDGRPKQETPPKDRRIVVAKVTRRGQPDQYKVMYEDEYDQQRREASKRYQEAYASYRESLKDYNDKSPKERKDAERPRPPDRGELPEKIVVYRDAQKAIDYATQRQAAENRRWRGRPVQQEGSQGEPAPY